LWRCHDDGGGEVVDAGVVAVVGGEVKVEEGGAWEFMQRWRTAAATNGGTSEEQERAKSDY
jgi:hypothetical protein